jgi:hypothetical protein
VIIEYDSKSAVGWTTAPRISKALESRDVKRLANSAREEVHALKDLGISVSIVHVAGEGNHRADLLSRILERDKIAEKLTAYFEHDRGAQCLKDELLCSAEGPADDKPCTLALI